LLLNFDIVRMFVIQLPLGRIVNDIFSDFVQFPVVADNVFIITALPSEIIVFVFIAPSG